MHRMYSTSAQLSQLAFHASYAGRQPAGSRAVAWQRLNVGFMAKSPIADRIQSAPYNERSATPCIGHRNNGRMDRRVDESHRLGSRTRSNRDDNQQDLRYGRRSDSP